MSKPWLECQVFKGVQCKFRTHSIPRYYKHLSEAHKVEWQFTKPVSFVQKPIAFDLQDKVNQILQKNPLLRR